MKIAAHCLFKNEERYLWFSVASVIDYIDKMMLWDTGSTDGSYEIAKLLKSKYPNKIELKQCGEITVNEFPKIRQKMLQSTKADWIIIVDGDEVWWEESISHLTGTILQNSGLETIVNTNINPVGDIYNVLSKSHGRYNIDSKHGFLNIRAISLKIPKLHAKGIHGVQGYYDKENKLIQLRSKNNRLHLGLGYMHMTNLKRSASLLSEKKVPKRIKKFKYSVGSPLPLDFYFPEVFFKPRPKIVPSPWKVRSNIYFFVALFQKPFKILKNRLQLKQKYGY